MEWYNAPDTWNGDTQSMTVSTHGKTDFWRVTIHGFIKDDAHFYHQEVSGDFEATVKITGQYATLYDQAGLMVRQDEKTWLKTGIEYVEGVQQASVVITHEFSDWSVVPLVQNPASIWIRVSRIGADVEVFYSLDGASFVMIRQAYFTPTEKLQVGLMCAAPQGNGFEVKFENFELVTKG